MDKRVILLSGTPCTGKTTLAKHLAQKLGAQYINLTEYAKTNDLILEEDPERKSLIVNEKRMRQKLTQTIQESPNGTIIIDGHFAQAVVPKKLATHVFVLRRNPKELKQFMTKCSFSEKKLQENLSAEILDVCLVEAIRLQKGKVCEVDATGKTVEALADEVMDVLDGKKSCVFGFVDWIGMLEQEGLTDEYLQE
ncbi:MAG: adenylate kinase family protein [Candidatus Bathyarchaeota archaeon]|nr:adenylate kinase family protein [Candidatus Bathyarchaeota archaeon]